MGSRLGRRGPPRPVASSRPRGPQPGGARRRGPRAARADHRAGRRLARRRGRRGGDARGRDALVERWNELAQNGEAAELEVGDDVYADGTHVIAVIDVSAPGRRGRTRSGRRTSSTSTSRARRPRSGASPRGARSRSRSRAAIRSASTRTSRSLPQRAEEARARNEFGPDDPSRTSSASSART